MPSSSSQLFVVHRDPGLVATLELLGLLHGLDVRTFLTPAGASAAIGTAWPLAIVAQDRLLLETGLDRFVSKLGERRSALILLSCAELGLPRRIEAKLSGVERVSMRGPWLTELSAALARRSGQGAPEGARARLLEAIRTKSDDSGQDAILALDADVEDEHLMSTLARHLARSPGADTALLALERILGLDRAAAPVVGALVRSRAQYRVAFALAMEIPSAGVDVLREIAESPEAPEELRVKAIGALAELLPPESLSLVLRSGAGEAPPLVRFEATLALLRMAERAGPKGREVLEATVLDGELPGELRLRALRIASRELPRSVTTPWMSSLVHDPEREIREAAAIALVKNDAVELEGVRTLLMDDSAPLERRRAALFSIGRDVNRELALPILEWAQGSSQESLRGAAFESFAERTAEGIESALERAAALGEAAQRACLAGANRRGVASLTWLSAIALREDFTPKVRAMAIRLAVARFRPCHAAPILEGALRSPSIPVATAAARAAVHAGVLGAGILSAAAIQGREARVRRAALEALDSRAADAVLRPVLSRAARDPDASVQSSAVKIAMRRAGRDTSMLPRIGSTKRFDLASAALDGAIAQGEGGFVAIESLATERSFPRPIRVRAIRALLERFLPEDLALDPASFAADELEEARAPARQLVASQPDALEASDTEPSAPAGAVIAPFLETRAGGRSKSGPQVPARPVDVAKESPGLRSEVFTTASEPRGPRPIEIPRARAALAAALAMGPRGFRGVLTLADSPRVPDEVRVLALRHLASDFPNMDLMDVFVRAMGDPSIRVQNAALGCAMLRKDLKLEAVAAVARFGASTSVRIRALRLLATRFERKNTVPILEVLVVDPDPEVRRAALDALFTSLRFEPAEVLEERLLNLLEGHHEVSGRISAAKALGAFGGSRARSVLEKLSRSLLADGLLKRAAYAALLAIDAKAAAPG